MSMRGIFGRLFGRKPRYTPKKGDGRTYGNWRAGDLAVCVRSMGWTIWETGQPSDHPPIKGVVYRVKDVAFIDGHHLLGLEGIAEFCSAFAFRKAQVGKIEACSRRFRDQMKRLRPKVHA